MQRSSVQIVAMFSMSELARRLTISNFPPISSCLRCYGDSATNRVCVMWLRCFWCVACAFTHEAIRDWEARFAPLITGQLRLKRQGQAGKSWYVDETYGHACMGSGVMCIEQSTTMVISLIPCSREKRNMEAAQTFFQQAVAVVGSVPDQITTDGHRSYPLSPSFPASFWEGVCTA
jgi:hypothetical protein